ncbi:MAG: protein kinase [Kouleothrix sp.]|nr:protein kinase [Kouleothrix sp.]
MPIISPTAMQETQRQSGSPSPLCPACGAALLGQTTYCPACGAALLGQTGRLPTNRLLAGRYRVVRLLARGGMGAVYLAEDIRLDGAQVAVKEMASSFARGDTAAFEQAVSEFKREAAMLARLRHPHLPRVSDRFDEDGKHFLVMEYIHGQTLRELIQRSGGRLPLDQALGYADQLCDVLAYLHAQQPPIVYRDLKPANVMVVSSVGDRAADPAARSLQRPVAPSQIVLIDFGIARFYRPGLSSDTAVYGTIGYAPPEQYGKGQTDARTDVYALGVLLHHMLTGYDPAASPFALPAPRRLDPSIPPAVAAAIERATAADRELRFPDIASLRAALSAPSAAPEPARSVVRAPIAAPAPADRRRAPRWPLLLAALAVVPIGIAAAIALMFAPLQRVVSPDSPAPIVESLTAREPQPSPIAPTRAPARPTDNVAVPVTTLSPSAVRASGASPPGIDSQHNPVSYDPANVADGESDTAWRVDGDGGGAWIELGFASEVRVTKVGIIPGYAKVDPFDGTDRFSQNRVVRRVRLEFSGGASQEATFAQQRAMQFVELPAPVRTHLVRVVILETYPPPEGEAGRDFTPISEVAVQGTLER